MKKKKKDVSPNLVADITGGKINDVSFGGDIPELGFSLKEWQDAYLINGRYETRNPDGSVRTKYNDQITDEGRAYLRSVGKLI